MAAIVLHDIDAATLDSLARLAEAHGRSLEAQAEMLLVQAVRKPTIAKQDRRASAERIGAMTPAGIAQTDSTLLVREDRDR